jgi:4-aminobutyrate aminotransferase-like enzyme
MTAPPFGSAPATVAVAPPGPESRALARRLARVEARSVTWIAPDFPVFWTEALGANVRDVDGNVYVDLTAAFGVAGAGHRHPAITRSIDAQAGRLMHGMGDVHPPDRKVELLERLAGLAPWAQARGILASAGSEAVEIALKTAQLATGRTGLVAFEGGYHGLTLGALSVTGREDFRAPFQGRVPGSVQFVPFPDASGNDAAEAEGALARALREAEAAGEPIAAVVVEPIQGRGGIRVPPPGFLARVRALAEAAGALVVFDEIFTGFGRTGALFALDHEGVRPDLLCLGKALGGGLPLSVCLGPPEVMDAWPASEGEALHTSTFLGHPVACAAALGFLDVLERERLVERASTEGERLRTRLEAALADHSDAVSVRGRGLFIGVALKRAGAGSDSRAGCSPRGDRAAGGADG